METRSNNLPIDEIFFEKMHSQWNARKIESSSLVHIVKTKFEETVGNVNYYPPENRSLRQEIIELENQIMELEGRLDTISGGFTILVNALIDTELPGEKKRALGKYLMMVLEFSQVTMDKILRLHDNFDKVRDEMNKMDKKTR